MRAALQRTLGSKEAEGIIMVILDTNVIIDHLRQHGRADTQLLRITAVIPLAELAISVISIQELFEGRSSKDREKQNVLYSVIAPLTTLPHTTEVARRAGEIARDSETPIEFADASIAATAMVLGAKLFTLNVKHFRNIPDLQLYETL